MPAAQKHPHLGLFLVPLLSATARQTPPPPTPNRPKCSSRSDCPTQLVRKPEAVATLEGAATSGSQGRLATPGRYKREQLPLSPTSCPLFLRHLVSGTAPPRHEPALRGRHGAAASEVGGEHRGSGPRLRIPPAPRRSRVPRTLARAHLLPRLGPSWAEGEGVGRAGRRCACTCACVVCLRVRVRPCPLPLCYPCPPSAAVGRGRL